MKLSHQSALTPLLSRLPRLLLPISILSLACGGPTPSQTTTRTSTPSESVSFNPLEDLLSQASSAVDQLQDPSLDAEAVVRFVIFTPSALPSTEASQEHLATTHFEATSTALKSSDVPAIALSKLAERFSVAHLSPSADLPLNRDAFIAANPTTGAHLSTYQGLTFVSYQGRALKKGLQISINCKITEALINKGPLRELSQSDVMIGVLSTIELLDAAQLSERCQDATERWVKPAAERLEEGVRLITRGLNQWGRPELELGPLPPEKARELYPLLVTIMTESITQPYPKMGTVKEGITLGTCQRPAHHYDTTCMRIQLP